MRPFPEERSLQKVIEVPGFSQKQIYTRTLEWMTKTYVSANEVIQLKDPDHGKLIGRGITYFTNGAEPFAATIPCEYIITVETKR